MRRRFRDRRHLAGRDGEKQHRHKFLNYEESNGDPYKTGFDRVAFFEYFQSENRAGKTQRKSEDRCMQGMPEKNGSPKTASPKIQSLKIAIIGTLWMVFTAYTCGRIGVLTSSFRPTLKSCSVTSMSPSARVIQCQSINQMRVGLYGVLQAIFRRVKLARLSHAHVG